MEGKSATNASMTSANTSRISFSGDIRSSQEAEYHCGGITGGGIPGKIGMIPRVVSSAINSSALVLASKSASARSSCCSRASTTACAATIRSLNVIIFWKVQASPTPVQPTTVYTCPAEKSRS